MLNPDGGPPPIPPDAQSAKAIIRVRCTNCGDEYAIQANFRRPQPLEGNAVAFPPDNVLVCRKCGNESDVAPLRLELEAQAGAPIVA